MTTTSGVSSTQTAAAKAAAAKAAATKAAQDKAAAAAAAANPAAAQTAQLPMLGTNVGAPGMVSPYDGTTATPAVGSGVAGLGGYPVETGGLPGSMSGLGAGGAQTNATNQSALATNGNVNQDVTNSNSYHNTYLNIIQSPYGGVSGYGGLNNGAFSGWGAQANGFGTPYVVDPATGQVYVQKKDGIIGWFERLFRGY